MVGVAQSRNETTSDIGLRYAPSVPTDGKPIAITRGVMYVRSRLNPSSMNRRFSFETRPRIIPVIFTRDAVFFPVSPARCIVVLASMLLEKVISALLSLVGLRL